MSADDPHGEQSDDELDPDEPRTPLWLPLVGLALLLCAGLYALLGGEETHKDGAEQAATASGDAGT